MFSLHSQVKRQHRRNKKLCICIISGLLVSDLAEHKHPLKHGEMQSDQRMVNLSDVTTSRFMWAPNPYQGAFESAINIFKVLDIMFTSHFVRAGKKARNTSMNSNDHRWGFVAPSLTQKHIVGEGEYHFLHFTRGNGSQVVVLDAWTCGILLCFA